MKNFFLKAQLRKIALPFFVLLFLFSCSKDEMIQKNPNLSSDLVLQPLQGNKWGLSLSPNKTFVNVQLTDVDFQKFKQKNEFTPEFIQGVTKDIYKYFKDDFEFISMLLDVAGEETENSKVYDYAGLNIAVSYHEFGIRAFVDGIDTEEENQKINNFTKEYGSEGNLNSILIFPARNYILDGPFLHEIMHQWANFKLFTTDIENFHWGVTGGNTAGQIGGFKQSTLETNVNGIANKYAVELFGRNANGGNTLPYSQMELYLMGLIPLSEVEPFDVFEDLIGEIDESGDKAVFQAKKRTTYTSEKLAETFKRDPDYTKSKKSFRHLVLLVTNKSNNKTTDSSVVLIDKHLKQMSAETLEPVGGVYSFYAATKGKATMSFEIESSLKR